MLGRLFLFLFPVLGFLPGLQCVHGRIGGPRRVLSARRRLLGVSLRGCATVYFLRILYMLLLLNCANTHALGPCWKCVALRVIELGVP